MKGSQKVSFSTLMALIDGIPDGKYIAVLDCNAYTIINENESKKEKKTCFSTTPTTVPHFFLHWIEKALLLRSGVSTV